MGFAQAVRICFRNYATFSGRAPRSEYWWFVAFLFLGSAAAGIVDAAISGGGGMADATVSRNASGAVSALFSLATILPFLAAGWRRMHDTGRSGLYLFYPVIVMVGIGIYAGTAAPLVYGAGAALQGVAGLVFVVASIVFMISPLLVVWWLARPSQPGQNRWGPAPHEAPT